MDDPEFSQEQIRQVAHEYKGRHGQYPTAASGQSGLGNLSWADLEQRLKGQGLTLASVCQAPQPGAPSNIT